MQNDFLKKKKMCLPCSLKKKNPILIIDFLKKINYVTTTIKALLFQNFSFVNKTFFFSYRLLPRETRFLKKSFQQVFIFIEFEMIGLSLPLTISKFCTK